MFPKLCNEMKCLIPEVYFGGEEVPPYLHAEMNSHYSLEDLVSLIRTIDGGGNSSGYIDDEGVHFHLPADEMIKVDLSKKFVFISQLSNISGANPSAWQTFFFLQEPTSRALFIGSDHATLLEKSDYTLRLCKDLDQLWAHDRFLETRMEMMQSEEGREKGLVCLMKAYEEETLESSSEMWEFWNTFGVFLMERSLGLSVHPIQ